MRKELKEALALVTGADTRIKNNDKVVAGLETELETIRNKISSKKEEIDKIQDDIDETELEIAKEASKPKDASKEPLVEESKVASNESSGKPKAAPKESTGLLATVKAGVEKAAKMIVGDDEPKAKVIKQVDKKKACVKELHELKKQERKKQSEIAYEKKFPALWPTEKKRVEESIPHLRKMLIRV